jgi:hypothetical protein
MKVVVAVVVLCFPLLAQGQSFKAPAACGDLRVEMAVDLDSKPEVRVVPQPDKALVYFIQETGQITEIGYPTTRIGLNGKWVGANKKNSYFSFFVAPGEQHLCVATQSSFIIDDRIELSHFNAEPGKVYYFRSRINMGNESAVYLTVNPIDSDQGEYLTGLFPLAKSQARK